MDALPTPLELAYSGLRAAATDLGVAEERAHAFLDALARGEEGAAAAASGVARGALAALDRIDLARRDLVAAIGALRLPDAAGASLAAEASPPGPPIALLVGP